MWKLWSRISLRDKKAMSSFGFKFTAKSAENWRTSSFHKTWPDLSFNHRLEVDLGPTKTKIRKIWTGISSRDKKPFSSSGFKFIAESAENWRTSSLHKTWPNRTWIWLKMVDFLSAKWSMWKILLWPSADIPCSVRCQHCTVYESSW